MGPEPFLDLSPGELAEAAPQGQDDIERKTRLLEELLPFSLQALRVGVFDEAEDNSVLNPEEAPLCLDRLL
jgi:hypothetical protein